MTYTIRFFLWTLLPLSILGIYDYRIMDKPAIHRITETEKITDSSSGSNDIVCLIYHRFGDSRYPSTNISTQLFQTQLRYLKDHNYNVITFGQAVKLVTGHENIPDKTIVITVDDGFLSFRENALPLLKQFGYKASLFVNTETIGDGDYMDWNDLAAILKDGFEIGNHSDSHEYFLNRKDDEVENFKNDILHAQKLLKDSLGIEPDLLAYPYGEFDNALKDAVKALGFKAAAAQNSGVFCESSDIFAIPRFPINEQYGNITMFIEKVNMKALRVLNSGEQTSLYEKNPPVLNVSIPGNIYDLDHLQGFIQGGNPKMNITPGNPVQIQLVSDRKLSARRVLYTLTVPGKNNRQWYWYSHVWINPEIKE